MSTAPEVTDPDRRLRDFAAAWLRLAGRQARVSSTKASAVTTLTQATATPLGERLVLATLTWSFGQGDTAATPVSDFLLDNEGDDRLRCVAYLPRTNVLDHLDQAR